jgi:tape measure domain-containing protein
MSTETIQIVIAESGAPEAAAGIRAVGESAAVSDVALGELLARSGTASSAMSAITSASGTAGAALNQIATGASSATAALVGTSNEATSAATRIGTVGTSSTEAAAGMRAASSAGAALVATYRETGAAAAQAAVAEEAVAAATARSGASHALTATRATAHGAALHHLGEEGEVLQNKLERLEITFIALGLALGIKELVEVTDVYANMSNQLDRIKVSAADFASKQDDIFRIAQQSRQPLEAINSLYVNMSMALKNTSIEAVDISKAIKTLADGATVSGKAVSETASALNRLGISMREGSVNGRGFLQFLVQMPEIGEKVAASLGFVGKNGFGNFVKAANDGKISTEEFIKQLVKINPVMAEEVKHMEVTVASAFVVLKNAYLDYIGRADHAAGASEKVAHAILVLADHIHAVIGVIAIITFGLGAYGVAVGTAALATAALAFSFAGIVGLLAAATAAVFFFGSAVKLTADGSVTAFSLIWGVIKTVVEVLGDLYTWATTTTNGMMVLAGAVTILAVAFGRVAFEAVLAGLRLVAGWIAASVLAIGPLLIALAALTVEYLAVRYATVALTQGIAAANADLGKMRDNLVQMASDIKTKFTQNITDTSGPLDKLKKDLHDVGEEANKASINIVRGGTSAGGSFKDLSKSGSDSAVSIVSGFGRSSGAIQKLGTDAASTATSAASSFGTIGGAANKATGDLLKVGEAGVQMGNMVRNAMGEMVQAESDWAARSGALFNKFSSDAQRAVSSASSLSSFTGSTAGYSAPSAQGFSSGWGISDVSRGSGYGISSLSQDMGKMQFATGGSFEVGGHGGTDSQLVQFLATPGERVSVETPGQQAAGGGKSGGYPTGDIHMHMTVVTPDANSFRENEQQIMLRMQNRLRTVQNRLGGN